MQIIRELNALRLARSALSGRVALVPTMGALHAGHMKLVEVAKKAAEHVVVSIFVNPKQFGPNEDYTRYPRQEGVDAERLEAAGVAILWQPDAAAMYPPGFATKVSVAGISEGLCGASRPGHFDGVATVVAKLFGQVRPDAAVFGEKDWQQLQVVRRLVADLDLGIEIAGVAIEREADGLALSSRNAFLSVAERTAAAFLPRLMKIAARSIASGEMVAKALDDAEAALRHAGIEVEYFVLVGKELQLLTVRTDGARLMAAVRVGGTRLIDNLALE